LILFFEIEFVGKNWGGKDVRRLGKEEQKQWEDQQKGEVEGKGIYMLE